MNRTPNPYVGSQASPGSLVWWLASAVSAAHSRREVISHEHKQADKEPSDGRDRVFEGSARRIRARFTRRSSELLQRAGVFGRLLIRFRIWRFAQRQAARRAPLEALYSTHGTKNHATSAPAATRHV